MLGGWQKQGTQTMYYLQPSSEHFFICWPEFSLILSWFKINCFQNIAFSKNLGFSTQRIHEFSCLAKYLGILSSECCSTSYFIWHFNNFFSFLYSSVTDWCFVDETQAYRTKFQYWYIRWVYLHIINSIQ